MTHALKRIYALAQWTTEKKGKGWYIRRTDRDEPWRGPYGTKTSVCLMIAKHLRRELAKRDGSLR